ncbi:putative oxidoreductase [Gordonia hirsuta DSM 44140 = NBRC 16056]|uniref:Putative oxidoreductase n=1 Tax=Gordonia hirsuta DSM 44140 = NBRC 16056 TaxID=1121927 RepID=L7LC63_9ACTN|nr:putative oxidoreductase [Gordonia hirsuta DSM 44140 = NBRC 16056]
MQKRESTMIDRRSLLVGAAAVGAAAFASPLGKTQAAPARVRLTREERRVVVIGSGFGGGVTALRLTQAGVPVLLLERGREWRTGPNAKTFPSAADPDERALWHRSDPTLFGRRMPVGPYVGLIDAVAGENMTALAPAGLGGGSLIYQGISLQPSQAVFEEHLPNRLDWPRLNQEHYPRVARMLKLAVAPDRLVRHDAYRAARAFASRARRAGRPVSKIPMPIDWNYALAELRGEMRPAYTDGSGALGVNNGGKHSVDVTYLKQARATGLLEVATLHEVTDVARAQDGRWKVRVNRTDLRGRVLENKIITTGTLVMAAGSVHTTRLLVRARATGAIADLPDAVGAGWGTNADRIYTWTSPTEDFGARQGGPVVFGSRNWSDPSRAHTVIQASIPPLGADLHTTMMVGFGVSKGRGRFVYDSGRGDAILRWPADGDSAVQWRDIHPTATAIAGPGAILGDSNKVVNTTWHPLGGACMGDGLRLVRAGAGPAWPLCDRRSADPRDVGRLQSVDDDRCRRRTSVGRYRRQRCGKADLIRSAWPGRSGSSCAGLSG